MKRKVHLLFPIILLAFLPKGVSAQKILEVNNETEFKNKFLSAVVSQSDSISKYVQQSGILFFRFNINDVGHVDSIICSEKQPVKLINVLTETLASCKFPPKETEKNNKYYVLPVFYNYLSDIIFPTTPEELKKMTPIIDLENINSYINFDYNGLFKTEETEKTLWGINCVLLPMIRVSKPMVYKTSSIK